jgi:tetratricopeptide (TPR) repeat protein
MRRLPLIVASIAALLVFGASEPVRAQQQSQTVPDAPQPQKKPAAKTESTTDKTDSKPPSTKDENPFPEDVSKSAAKAGSSDSGADGSKKPAATDNPFPESVSRDAAKAAGNDPDPAPAAKRDLPPGVSSSQSSGTEENEPDAPANVVDPARSKKDAEVGGFYLKSGEYQGALLRFKDATASDPTNVEAIFGLAETQRMLKKNAEAARNYQLYLDIMPNGPRSKQALKALKALSAGG